MLIIEKIIISDRFESCVEVKLLGFDYNKFSDVFFIVYDTNTNESYEVKLLGFSSDESNDIVCTLYNTDTDVRQDVKINDIIENTQLLNVYNNSFYILDKYELKLFNWLSSGQPVMLPKRLKCDNKYKFFSYKAFKEPDFRYIRFDYSSYVRSISKSYTSIMGYIIRCLKHQDEINCLILDKETMSLYVLLDKVYNCGKFYKSIIIPRLCDSIKFDLSCSYEEFSRFITKLRVLSTNKNMKNY